MEMKMIRVMIKMAMKMMAKMMTKSKKSTSMISLKSSNSSS